MKTEKPSETMKLPSEEWDFLTPAERRIVIQNLYDKGLVGHNFFPDPLLVLLSEMEASPINET